jgi:hypothetical protein
MDQAIANGKLVYSSSDLDWEAKERNAIVLLGAACLSENRV